MGVHAMGRHRSHPARTAGKTLSPHVTRVTSCPVSGPSIDAYAESGVHRGAASQKSNKFRAASGSSLQLLPEVASPEACAGAKSASAAPPAGPSRTA